MERKLKENENTKEKEVLTKTQDRYNKKGANLMTMTQRTAYELALKKCKRSGRTKNKGELR